MGRNGLSSGPLWRHGALAAIILLLTLTGGLRLSTPAVAEEQVDLLLVLAADISRSVNATKFNLQREGYAAAITNAKVLAAIESAGRIAVCFVEWSGAEAQVALVDWTAIGTAEEARSFADRILVAPRLYMDRTSISAAIDFSLAQFSRSPFTASRHVIDISGDGTNNHGREVTQARDEALAAGVTINGIAILSDVPLPSNPVHTHPPGGLLKYYENNVIGGPGAFALAAEDHEAFGRSLISKLIKEIALAPFPD
jgi:hypothetical protein